MISQLNYNNSIITEKKILWGGRQWFFVCRMGCLEAKGVQRVEENNEQRCPGDGDVDTVLG